MTPELVAVGNLLVDDVVHADGTTRMAQPGGAVLYVALAARLCGLSVGIVSWRGDDYPEAALEALARCDVDLDGVHALDGPGVRTWLLDEGPVRQLVHRLQGPGHAEVSPGFEHIPEAWRAGARAFHLAPMPLAVQAGLVRALASRPDALVSLDPYELLRVESDLETWRPLLADVDVLFLSEDEMLLDLEPRTVLERLAGERLRQVAFKRGRRGGLLFDSGRFLAWQAGEGPVADTTGAGDAFAAGFLAGKLRGEPVDRSLELGVRAAGVAIGAPGPDGLLAALADDRPAL